MASRLSCTGLCHYALLDGGPTDWLVSQWPASRPCETFYVVDEN